VSKHFSIDQGNVVATAFIQAAVVFAAIPSPMTTGVKLPWETLVSHRLGI
jgi:hypothetical protein